MNNINEINKTYNYDINLEIDHITNTNIYLSVYYRHIYLGTQIISLENDKNFQNELNEIKTIDKVVKHLIKQGVLK